MAEEGAPRWKGAQPPDVTSDSAKFAKAATAQGVLHVPPPPPAPKEPPKKSK